jgi:SnoaL-like domain
MPRSFNPSQAKDPTMTTLTREQIATAKFEILENSITSLCHRDNGDWAGLGKCFHADSRITTSWFDGTAAEFVAQSDAMMSGHHPTDTQRHMMSNPRITLNGKRAACEYYVILHQGRTLDGYEFDFQTWSVTIDLHELRDGAWRICTRKMIYEKSRMDPHVPGAVPQSYYDSLDLSPFPPAIRFHCYRNLRSSGQMPKNLIMKGSPEEAAARREVAAWVA